MYVGRYVCVSYVCMYVCVYVCVVYFTTSTQIGMLFHNTVMFAIN
jgi:hypothetical protein